MTNRADTDLFGNPVGEAQLELFAEEEVRPQPQRYVPKPELVRNSLRTLERRVRELDPAQVEDWLAEEQVAFFRRQLDYFCERLAETVPEEVSQYRDRIAPLIDALARRLGVAES